MKLSPQKIEIISDLFTNLAAGWYGSIIIFPGIFQIKTLSEILNLLFISITFGTLSLCIAFYFKEHKIHD